MVNETPVDDSQAEPAVGRTSVAKVILSDGREVKYDLTKITISEYRALFDKNQAAEEEDTILARVVGMELDEFQALPLPDWRLVVENFFVRAREPLTDPNSASASTTT